MRHSFRAALLAASLLTAPAAFAQIDLSVLDNTGVLPLPTGQFVTPTAATGSNFATLNPGLADHPAYRAGWAVNSALSPDGKTLLVLTSGYTNLADANGNAEPSASNQYVFVYDVSAATPVQKQVLQVPYTFMGLVWAPDGSHFYVSGGADDRVAVFAQQTPGVFAASASIKFGHAPYGAAFAKTPLAPFGAFLGSGLGLLVNAETAGLGLSADGTVLAAANIYNDSVSVIDTATNTVRYEYDLRPFHTSGATQTGVAGGEAPFGIAIKGTATAYISALRDREIVVVNIAGVSPSLITRIKLAGSPNSVLLSADQSKLYVTEDNQDRVAIIDTATNTLIEEIDAIAPAGLIAGTRYTGAAPNNLALSPDGRTLYVTQGGANAVAVIPLSGAAPHAVSGLIPTAWYPSAVTVSTDGRTLYVTNSKGDPGRDPAYETGSANQYIEQLEQAGLTTIPVPNAASLATLTAQVAANNGYASTVNATDAAVMAGLRANIKHVIYIIKENRTFDQILGDLGNGSNGDPSLTMYGRRVTPNFHKLSTNFVTLDNFFDSGEVSGNGWDWSTEGRESDYGTKTIPNNYANGNSFANDSEGTMRNINVGNATLAARLAGYPSISGVGSLYGILGSALPGGVANLLPGGSNDFATDGPTGTPAQQGYIWDAALRAGLTVRDYGVFIDVAQYVIPDAISGLPPTYEFPFAAGKKQATSTNPTLGPVTDPYFRGFDNQYPDAWREEEWAREFAAYEAAPGDTLPALTMLRYMHDHTGNFGTAVAGVNTPELQQADNDYAVGATIDAVAHSKFAGSTLIFVIEDDAQDGPDHMDAHRSTAYVVGPYVKQHAVVSTRYSTVNMVRTIEDVLGTDHLCLNTAHQRPMTDIFDLTQSGWTYSHVASTLLKATTLTLARNDDGVRFAEGPDLTPTHDAAYWDAATKGFDFTAEDRVPADLFNEVLWQGAMGTPYPAR